MSGQYPGAYNNPMGGHRGQFNPQQQQQMLNQMSNVGPNTMAASGSGSGVLPMSGYSQSSMMPQQQNSNGSGLSQQQTQHLLQQQQMQIHGSHMSMGGTVPTSSTSTSVATSQQQQLSSQQTVSSVQSQQQQQTNTSSAQGSATATTTSSNMLAISQPNPNKEINIVALSRLGQETVQDITSRFQEIFTALKIIQPTSNRDNNTEKKVQEYFRTIRLLFKRVRIIYEKCNDGYPQGIEYTHVESLIPFKDDPEHRIEPPQCEEYRKALQENQELIETVKLKNRQLREIIDRTRIIIWEINTMLNMRRS